MKAFSMHRTRFLAWFAPALVAGLLECGKSNNPAAQADAATSPDGARSATGGSSTGGNTSGTGGATPGTGGATSGSGGAAGGATSNTGGATPGGTTSGTGGASTGGATTGGATTGGSSSITGGSTASTGGSKGDAGPGATGGATSSDAGPAKDGGADAQQDVALDIGPTPNDVPAADAGPPAGDGGINVPDGYKLIWSDEFNTDGTPDPKNWNYEKGFVRNNELQWYQSNNATVKGGLLVIEGRREQVANTNYVAGSADWRTNRQYAQYTSTSMTTSGLQTWQYGRFEMRARIPTSVGMWPAWWALGVSGEWPASGEIDMMEFYKGNVLANVACGTATRWSAKWDSTAEAISSLGANWSSNFHTWRMDWDDQNINLYLDDVLMNGVPLSTMLNADGTSPFKQKIYMILNLALGGDNGGDPSATTFPVQYEVDYVRVFQKL
jgi:beta-glucanase (GH16 family)